MPMILKTSEQHLFNTLLQLILSFKRGSSSIQSNLDFLSNCHSDFLSLFGCSPHRRLSESFKRAAAANSPLIAETPPFSPGRALPGSYGHALCHLILCRRGFLAAAFGDEFWNPSPAIRLLLTQPCLLALTYCFPIKCCSGHTAHVLLWEKPYFSFNLYVSDPSGNALPLSSLQPRPFQHSWGPWHSSLTYSWVWATCQVVSSTWVSLLISPVILDEGVRTRMGSQGQGKLLRG